MNSVRRSSAILVTVVALVGGSTVFPSTASAKQSCKDTSTNKQISKFCINIKSIDNSHDFKVHFSTNFDNKTSRTVTGTCEVRTSKTTKYSASATVAAEAGFVFGKASAAVSGGLEKSVTSEVGTKVTFQVPPRTTMKCSYGTARAKVSGKVWTVRCHPSKGCTSSSKEKWTLVGPRELTWKISKAD